MYFRTEDLLEVQEIISEIMSPNERYMEKEKPCWFAVLRSKPWKFSRFREWYYKQYGQPSRSWKGGLLPAMLADSLTAQGREDFLRLAERYPWRESA